MISFRRYNWRLCHPMGPSILRGRRFHHLRHSSFCSYGSMQSQLANCSIQAKRQFKFSGPLFGPAMWSLSGTTRIEQACRWRLDPIYAQQSGRKCWEWCATFIAAILLLTIRRPPNLMQIGRPQRCLNAITKENQFATCIMSFWVWNLNTKDNNSCIRNKEVNDVKYFVEEMYAVFVYQLSHESMVFDWGQ